MLSWKSISRELRRIAIQLLIMSYLLRQFWGGRYGLKSQMGIDAKLDGGLLQQLEIMAQRKRIRVMGLQQESLDMDLLEEEWRRHFGLRTPNEVVLNTGGLLNSQ